MNCCDEIRNNFFFPESPQDMTIILYHICHYFMETFNSSYSLANLSDTEDEGDRNAKTRGAAEDSAIRQLGNN